MPAEDAIEAAKALQLADKVSSDQVNAVNSELLRYLTSDDDFWPRWRYFAEQHGDKKMMKLTRTDEPTTPDFDALVRKPGEAFLLTNPTPKHNEWKHHDYWRRIAPTLRTRYNGICAYSCYFIHEVTGDDTIEHFRPKTPNPTLAYEWTNYRYVCGKLNTWKRTDESVLDPFEIEDGWFFIEFSLTSR